MIPISSSDNMTGPKAADHSAKPQPLPIDGLSKALYSGQSRAQFPVLVKEHTSFLYSVAAASLPLFFHSSHAEDRVDTLINRSESKGEGTGDNTLDTSWSAPHAVLLFGKISQNMIMADGSSGSDVLSSRVRGSGYKHWGIID